MISKKAGLPMSVDRKSTKATSLHTLSDLKARSDDTPGISADNVLNELMQKYQARAAAAPESKK